MERQPRGLFDNPGRRKNHPIVKGGEKRRFISRTPRLLHSTVDYKETTLENELRLLQERYNESSMDAQLWACILEVEGKLTDFEIQQLRNVGARVRNRWLKHASF